MFYRLIAGITRDHLVDHLPDYIGRIKGDLDTDTTIVLPHSFEIGSIMGGAAGIGANKAKNPLLDVPALTIDAFLKATSTDNSSLWSHVYTGRISGIVVSTNLRDAEAQAKAWLAMTELFFQEHQFYPYANDYDASSLPFSFLETGWSNGQTMGAAQMEKTDASRTQTLWMDGFSADLAWYTSEQGPWQHG